MPRSGIRSARAACLNERGVALPLALVGLVAISLLVTAAMLTSTTEHAISSAQTDATRSVYEAEGAIQAYIAQNVAAGVEFQPGTYAYTPPGATRAYDVGVARLAQFQPAGGAGTTADGYGIYSVQAEENAGGRSLIAMLRVPLKFLNMNINAGATLGNNAVISGSIDINATSNLCASDTADDAIVHADGTTLEIKGQAARNIGNDTSTYAGDRQALANHVLNGMQIRDLARRADIRFRQASSNPDSVFAGTRPNANTYSKTGPSSRYNWGCPAEMTTCSRDTDYYPLVVIDAMNADGTRGSVTINGDHGQGMLLVLNGNLRVQGNFLYKGIILVEGETNIHGGGGGSGGAKIEGALLGLGDLEICNTSTTECVDGTLEDGTTAISSGAVIQFNQCAINAVQQYLNSEPVQAMPRQPTFAWYEVVR